MIVRAVARKLATCAPRIALLSRSRRGSSPLRADRPRPEQRAEQHERRARTVLTMASLGTGPTAQPRILHGHPPED